MDWHPRTPVCSTNKISSPTRQHTQSSLSPFGLLSVSGAGSAATLASLQAGLRSRVVGQDDAVAAVATAIQCRRVGLGHAGKPIGVFMFTGPRYKAERVGETVKRRAALTHSLFFGMHSGVGKTELAKSLAHELFGSDGDDALLRVDMVLRTLPVKCL